MNSKHVLLSTKVNNLCLKSSSQVIWGNKQRWNLWGITADSCNEFEGISLNTLYTHTLGQDDGRGERFR